MIAETGLLAELALDISSCEVELIAFRMISIENVLCFYLAS
jgi:hypothetical protein